MRTSADEEDLNDSYQWDNSRAMPTRQQKNDISKTFLELDCLLPSKSSDSIRFNLFGDETHVSAFRAISSRNC